MAKEKKIKDGPAYRAQLAKWEERRLEVVRLRDEEHLTFKKIGERLGVTRAFAQSMYQRQRSAK